MASTPRPRCNKSDCFQNWCGNCCELLTSYPSQPCPFYQTQEKVDAGRLRAHQRLIAINRRDLVDKYEYNKFRKGNW